MKNSIRTFTRISLLLIICIGSMLKTHAMDEKEAEPLAAGCMNIAGVDQAELIKALYEHTTEHEHTQISSEDGTTESSHDSILSSFVSGLSRRWESTSSAVTAEPKSAKEYNRKLQKFIEDYKMNLIGDTGNPSTLYVASYNKAYGENAAKSIYDKLLEKVETERLAEAYHSALKRRSSKESQKASAGLLTQSERKDDVAVIHLNPSRNPPSSTYKDSASLDIFGPREGDK
jgi:hypothetical protein